MVVAKNHKGMLALLLLLTAVSAGQSASAARPVSPAGIVEARPASREITFTGYTRARYMMDIIGEESGRCVRVLADVGDSVGPDGGFALLDTTFIDLALEQNRVAQSRLGNQIAYYDKDVHRYLELVGRAAAAQATLDGLRHQKEQAVFELQALKVEWKRLKERRKRFTIKAPLGWTVTERLVEPDEWVAVGQPLGRAGDFRTLLIPFAVSPAEYRALVKRKNQLELFFPDEAEHGVTVAAVLERISPAFDSRTRKIDLDLEVQGGLETMRGGLRAELTLTLPDPSGTVLVPAAALVERYQEFWLVRATGQREKVAYLGKGPDDTVRIRASHVKSGDKFQLAPKW